MRFILDGIVLVYVAVIAYSLGCSRGHDRALHHVERALLAAGLIKRYPGERNEG